MYKFNNALELAVLLNGIIAFGALAGYAFSALVLH